QLRIFATIARERSFIKAAASLYLTEATVSEQIKLLEHRVGMRLLDRSRGRRGIAITEAGRIVLESCEKVLEALDRAGLAVDALAGHILGGVSLGTGMTFGAFVFPSLYEAFQQTHPGIIVHVESAPRGHLLDDLARGDLDLAVLLGPSNNENYVSEV